MQDNNNPISNQEAIEAEATRDWPTEAEDIATANKHAANAIAQAEEAEATAAEARDYAAEAEDAVAEAERWIEELQAALEERRDAAERANDDARLATEAAENARQQANYAITIIGAYQAERATGTPRSAALQKAMDNAKKALGRSGRDDTESDVRDGGGDCGLSNATGCLYENAREENEKATAAFDEAEQEAHDASRQLDC